MPKGAVFSYHGANLTPKTVRMNKLPLLLLVSTCLLSNSVYADWLPSLPSLPSPDKWLNQQCLSRIAQYPKIKLNKAERNSTCNCMTAKAKRNLSTRDILDLAQLSDAELEQKYGPQAKQAFETCKPTKTAAK